MPVEGQRLWVGVTRTGAGFGCMSQGGAKHCGSGKESVVVHVCFLNEAAIACVAS